MSVPWHLTTRQSLITSLSLDQLFAFQMVVRSGSFRAAGADLGLTQAAVSQRMRHLENILGCALFERRPGARAQLTAAGGELLAFADEMLATTDRFHERLEHMKSQSHRSTLTIVSGSDHIKHVLIEAVAAMKRKAPSLRVVIRHVPATDRIVDELASGRADLGICRSPVPSTVQPLGTIHEELYLFASPDDPINALAEEDRIGHLNHADFASFAAGMRSRELVDRWAERIGVTLNVVVESRTIETMRAYVVRGLAVAVLPQFSAVEDVRAGQAVMVPLRGLPLTRSAVVLARPELAASYEVRLFLDLLPVPVGAEPWAELGRSAAG